VRPSSAVDDVLIGQLEHGPLHRFADYATLTDVIPGSGAGVYTIWDDAGGLVYTGIAGRNPAGKGLASRLRSHASGRRSGDQFCVYVADHYVLPELPASRSRRSATRVCRWTGSCARRSTPRSGSASSLSTTTRRRSRPRISSRVGGSRRVDRASTRRDRWPAGRVASAPGRSDRRPDQEPLANA
jgi:hypothetical protein